MLFMLLLSILPPKRCIVVVIHKHKNHYRKCINHEIKTIYIIIRYISFSGRICINKTGHKSTRFVCSIIFRACVAVFLCVNTNIKATFFNVFSPEGLSIFPCNLFALLFDCLFYGYLYANSMQ